MLMEVYEVMYNSIVRILKNKTYYVYIRVLYRLFYISLGGIHVDKP